MGFNCFTIPVRFPTTDKLKNYLLTDNNKGTEVNILAPYLLARYATKKMKSGDITDKRFGEEELIKIESKGRASFALQYMLDTSLSDAERYPLRQFNLITMAINPMKAPLTVQWGRDNDKGNYIKDIPNLGFSGDHFLRPLFIDKEWETLESKVLFVDHSGRGADETAWAIVGVLNGINIVYIGGTHEIRRCYDTDSYRRKYDVQTIEVEPNFGQMWLCIQPVLSKVYLATICESEWAKGQKN